MKIDIEFLIFISLMFLLLMIYFEFRDLEREIKKISDKIDSISERD